MATGSAIAKVTALLRRLRLPYVRAHAPEVLSTARAQRWDPAEVLKVLLAEEVAGRDRSGEEPPDRAAFPSGKWDKAASAIPAPTQRALRTLEWIERLERLVIRGPSGTGKSHLLEALGHTAVEGGRRVLWFSLEVLGAIDRRHRRTTRWAGPSAGCSARTSWWWTTSGCSLSAQTPRRGSTAWSTRRTNAARWPLASNLHPAGFDELMPKTWPPPTVDRLLHHAHMVMTEGGESYRLAEATSGKRVVPLA